MSFPERWTWQRDRRSVSITFGGISYVALVSGLPECFPSVLLYLVLWTFTLIGCQVKTWWRMKNVKKKRQSTRIKKSLTQTSQIIITQKGSHRPHWRREQCGGSARLRDPPQTDTPPASTSWTLQPVEPAPQISENKITSDEVSKNKIQDGW